MQSGNKRSKVRNEHDFSSGACNSRSTLLKASSIKEADSEKPCAYF